MRQDITSIVTTSLAEDIGNGDITAELIPKKHVTSAQVITRDECVVCGTAWFNEVFEQLGNVDTIEWHVKEGDFVQANTKLVTLQGNARTLLTGERSALNFLQLLSGIATKSRAYAKLVEGTNIQILDTRKTIPGLRTAQKYAVTIGGSHNHRIGLYDAFLIKENHIAACGGITKAVAEAKSTHPDKPIIVEVESIRELKQAINAQVDRVMLDNFSEEQKRIAFSLNKQGVKYEASGNIDLQKIKSTQTDGIDCISIGDLTKNIQCIDLSMRICE